jgi:tight adherence protein B
MLWISLILFAIVIILMRSSKQNNVDRFFKGHEINAVSFRAINIKSLAKKQRWQSVADSVSPTLKMLGPRSSLYIFLYVVLSGVGSWYVLTQVLGFGNYGSLAGLTLLLVVLGYRYLLGKRRKEFENTFPDALNILMSAVSAGDSLMKAIVYVGDTMDGPIGQEFKHMGDRLMMGETPEVVLQRSCKNYPYPEFLFFTVTIRANIARGGQLKGVLARLIRVLVDSRTLDKKKMAMTSEARISAKIVAAIPVIFMLLLNHINPANVDFVLHDPKGQYILYYVLGSEFLGLSIIWLLVKGVKA